MTTVSDISNTLSADAEFVGGPSNFYSSVFLYGMGAVELLSDWGYQPGEDAMIEIESALDAAETYSEGQALPSPIESTYLNAKFTFKHFRGVIRESGHERRARGPADQGRRVKDPERKMKRAIESIKDKMAKTFDDAATHGLEGQVSAGTYAFGDQVRTTHTSLKAYELNASTAAVSTALLGKFFHVGADTPYGVNADIGVTSSTQARRIAELGAGKLAIPHAAGGLNLVWTDLLIGTAPVVIMPNLTTSIVLLLSGVRAGKWGMVWNEANPGRFHVLDLGAANMDNPLNLQISTSCAMAHTNPNEQGKLYGLSTG